MTSLYYNGRAFILPKQALTNDELIERLEAASWLLPLSDQYQLTAKQVTQKWSEIGTE